MKYKSVKAIYFSPAGSTERVAVFVAKTLAKRLGVPYETASYTLPGERDKIYDFGTDEIVIWASPVYAGRLPNKTLDYVKSAINGHCTNSIAIVTYGNRSYGDALAELTGIMKDNGCVPIGAAAVVARHAFTDEIAGGRPDERDLEMLNDLCARAAEKLDGMIPEVDAVPGNGQLSECCDPKRAVAVPGNEHPSEYYVPKKEDGLPAKFLKAVPKVDEDKCTGCGKCRDLCPMGSIRMTDGGAGGFVQQPVCTGICIKCQACIRGCGAGALYIDDEDFLSHVKMLEENYADEKESEIFV